MKSTMQERKKDGKFDKKQRDIFLLWGEYPKGWAMVKDLVLCVFLINAFIASAQTVDIAALMAPETKEFVNSNVIHKAEAKEVVKEEKQQEGAKTSVQEVAKKVYVLESSGGKNDSCKEKGMFNGYGYAQHKKSWMCYETQEEVKELVEKWFAEKLSSGMEVSEATCYYNTGVRTKDCQYYENYKKL